jgi:Protein of unknown function (DUF3352)
VCPWPGPAVYNALSGGGTQPHDVLPAGAIGYARIDLDPSATQKIQALRFFGSFPSFVEATGIDDPREDVRRAIFEAMKEDTGCDLDFEDDVDPWLGERMGVAVFPPADDTSDPGFAVALQVKDEERAATGIEDLLACGSDDEPTGGSAFLDGYLILAETRRLAAEYVGAAEKTSLADDPVFAADMERLDEPGVASVWFDGQGMFDLARWSRYDAMARTGSERTQLTERMERAVQESYASGALAFRFDDSHAEVASVVSGDAYEQLDNAGSASTDLPETTALALGLADGERWVDRQWDALQEMGEGATDVQRAVDELQQQTGLQLPKDLQTLLGEDFSLAVDGSGLDELAESGEPSDLRAGARITTDMAAFDALWADLIDLAARNGVPYDLTKVETEDGVAVGTTAEFAATMAEGGALGHTATFQAAVEDAERAQAYIYLDVNAFDELIRSDAEGDPAVVDNVEPLRAIGVSMRIDDGFARATARVTLD